MGILAFLSSLKDGPDHIPAVCVQEDIGNRSLRVLLAVNKRTYLDGNKVLDSIKEGFEPIFSVLRQISDGEFDAYMEKTPLIGLKAVRPTSRVRSSQLSSPCAQTEYSAG